MKRQELRRLWREHNSITKSSKPRSRKNIGTAQKANSFVAWKDWKYEPPKKARSKSKKKSASKETGV